MTRRTSPISPARDRRLRLWQNSAIALIALGVALLVYLAVAHTA